MNPILASARMKTQRAVDTFQHAMNQVDAELRSIVSRHPELLEEAEDLQRLRDFDLQRCELAANEHPAAPLPPIVDEPHTPTEAEAADIGRPSDPIACPTCGLSDPSQHPTVEGTDTISMCNDPFHVAAPEQK